MDFTMVENNLVTQLKKHYNKLEEDVDLDIHSDAYQLDEYRYVLGDKQKQMIMDENARRPYDLFKYYFLKAGNLESDAEIMKACFDERWIIKPGVKRLCIECDDITYMNQFEDEEFMNKLIASIDSVNEEIDLDYTDDKGYTRVTDSGAGYIMGTKEKLKLIELMRSLGKDGKFKFEYDYKYTPDTLDDHIDGRWVLALYDKQDDTIELLGAKKPIDKDDGYWHIILEFPIEYLKSFIIDEDADKVINTLRGPLKESVDLEVSSNNHLLVADKLAEQIGDCQVVDGVIYQLMDEFEIYDDYEELYRDIPHGIFAIYEILPGKIVAWNSRGETCEDVELIGEEPVDYFTGTRIAEFDSLKGFIGWLDSYFGRGWFGDADETAQFIDDLKDLLSEDFDIVDVDKLDDREKILYGDDAVYLNDKQKDDIAAALGLEEEDWNELKDKDWVIIKDSPLFDDYFNEDELADFPYALIIDGRFYDALSSNTGDEYFHKEG